MKNAPVVPEAALRLLLEGGFDATSVEQLAAVAGMSRSTFFRRFGSKEDMVFADLESVISLLHEVLATHPGPPERAVVAAALAVFDRHVSRPEAAVLRHRLLQEVPALRDRELVSTHRYERAFREFLASPQDGDDGDARASSTAFAAAVVAVHNDHLRRWLRRPDGGIRARLERQLGRLALLFAPLLGAGPAPATRAGATVVVTVLEPGASTDAVLEAVRRALPSTAAPLPAHASPRNDT